MHTENGPQTPEHILQIKHSQRRLRSLNLTLEKEYGWKVVRHIWPLSDDGVHEGNPSPGIGVWVYETEWKRMWSVHIVKLFLWRSLICSRVQRTWIGQHSIERSWIFYFIFISQNRKWALDSTVHTHCYIFQYINCSDLSFSDNKNVTDFSIFFFYFNFLQVYDLILWFIYRCHQNLIRRKMILRRKFCFCFFSL